MPSTYSPQDALNLVQTYAHGIPVTGVQAAVCDMIHSMIWTFYPWRWTVASLTPITTLQGVQDYAPTNLDILRPLKLRLVRTDVVPNEFREMSLLANLSPELSRTGGLESITSAGWYPSSNVIRLMYAVQTGGTQILQIQGEYQVLPTRITDANLSNVFVFPDHFFNCFVEGLKWKLYQLTDDPRAGVASYSKNGTMMRQYSGQLGTFQDALLQMARTEDLGQGDEFSFPEQPLGVGRSYWPGLYGI